MNVNTWNRIKTEVEHLTLRYQGVSAANSTDATILRLRVERLLDTADLQPAGLPSGAIFIVRKLEHPMPLPLASSSYSLPQSWKASMREQMDNLYAHAACPAHGPVSYDANSVLFTDAGEMLTCLTRDLLAVKVRQLWYWQALLRNIPHAFGPALTTLWCKWASSLPSVFASLHMTEAAAALTRLSPSELFAVANALHTSFELSTEPLMALQQVATTRARPQDMLPFHHSSSTMLREGATPGEILLGSHSQNDGSPESSLHTPTVPPWQRWLDSAATASLTPQAQYLLGLGLSLYHMPAFARSEKFAQQAISWLRTPSIEPRVTRRRIARVTQPPRLLFRQNTLDMDSPRDTTVKPFLPEVSREPSPDADSVPSFTATAGEVVSSSNTSPASLPVPVPGIQAPSGEDREEEGNRNDRRNKAASSQPKKFTFGASREFPSDGVFTELGGILYLINVLTWLHLPDGLDEAFAEERSYWAILEALARALLGAWQDNYADNPIWSILALLDQRDPGTHVSEPVVRWLEHNLDFIRTSLLRRLNSPEFDDEQFALKLFNRPGQLVASRTHVDLYMSMEQISLPIRLAGLDRDPGWVPDFGRIVLFHFL